MRQLASEPACAAPGLPARCLLAIGAAVVLLWMPSVRAIEKPAHELLQRADSIKTSNHAEFLALLQRLESQAEALSAPQRQQLHYLQGWQSAYSGDYESAITALQTVIRETSDLTLRFRAAATVANVLVLATRYEDAFSQLSHIVATLPRITDKDAREQGLGVAAFLYNQVGEYELGLSYAQKLVQENPLRRGACRGEQLRVEALYRSGRADEMTVQMPAAIETCLRSGELSYANAIRTYMARTHMDRGAYTTAIDLLRAHYPEVRQTRYPRLLAEFDALLAQAHQRLGNTALARQFAHSALERAARQQFSEPRVIAYRLLYELERQRGDFKSALAYHESYAAADKGYLDDVSARQLAYERVSHEMIANRLQIDALNRQNQVLQLRQELTMKAAETSRLYIALLITVLAFIALWAYRTKRSQLHFMKLSRVDGLTGIANRPHFIELAERALEGSRKLQQEVCVVLCDLDHFKGINDKHGHAAGDFVLKQAVQACRAHLRASDLFGRFGGEEFCILLPGCSLAEARQRCEQLRAAIATTAADAEQRVPNVSASFGVAATGTSGYELRQLLAHADAALYRAKHAGRNCVVLYDAMHVIGSFPDAEPRLRGSVRP